MHSSFTVGAKLNTNVFRLNVEGKADRYVAKWLTHPDTSNVDAAIRCINPQLNIILF